MNNNTSSFTPRKKLPHDIPDWAKGDDVYFITINTMPRGLNQLAHDDIAELVKNYFMFYQNNGTLWVEYLLLMPDHLHILIVFNKDMKKSIQQFKRYISTKSNVKWQPDFFDHRIRNNESESYKWDYIYNNPVRKGLVQNSVDWKYQWINGLQSII